MFMCKGDAMSLTDERQGERQVSDRELLPCPFCGGVPILHHGHADITYLLCDACGAVASFRPNLKGQDTVRAWNRRAAEIGRDVK